MKDKVTIENINGVLIQMITNEDGKIDATIINPHSTTEE